MPISNKLYLGTQVIASSKFSISATISTTTPAVFGPPSQDSPLWPDINTGALGATQGTTTSADTNPQPQCFLSRFISPYLSAQTINSQNLELHIAGSESNAASNFQISYVVAVWRESTASIVGRLTDLAVSSAEVGTSPTAATITTSGSTSVAVQDGDVIILEVWRDSTAQAMATAYQNSIHYAGTVDDASSVNNAAYLYFPNGITLQLSAQYAQAQAQIKAFGQTTYGQAGATIPSQILRPSSDISNTNWLRLG